MTYQSSGKFSLSCEKLELIPVVYAPAPKQLFCRFYST